MNRFEQTMKAFEQGYLAVSANIIDHPVKWIFGWILVATLLLVSLAVDTKQFTEFQYHSGPYLYFTEDNADFQTLQQMESRYAPDTSLIFVFSPNEGDIFTIESLSAIEEITEIAWTLPYVSRVDSISNFQHTEVAGDTLSTDHLYTHADTLSKDDIEKIKRIALNEKALLRQTLSESGQVAAIIATVRIDEAQTKALEIMPLANKTADELRLKYPDGKIMFLGDVPIAAATNTATLDTFTKTSPIAMTLVLICLIILLRNVYSILVTQLIIVLSIGLAFCIFVLSGYMLSPISAGASPIILTLAVADCIHILVTYQQQCSLNKDKKEAMMESLRLNFSPVWLTSITTGIGFLMMNFAESPPFHDLGNAVFIGVMLGFFLSVSLLPAIMVLLPKPNYPFGNSQIRYMKNLAQFTIKQRKKLLWGMSIGVLLLISFIPMNRVNDILTEYFDETFEVRRALDFYVSNMGGLQRLQFVVPAKGAGGITEPEYLKHLDELIQWIEAQPKISHARSFVDVVKRLNKSLHEGDQTYYTIPDNRELIAQYLLLYELGLPFGLGLDTQVDMNKSETKLEIVFERIHSDEIVTLRNEIHQWMRANWPDYMQASATGMDSLFSDITFANVHSMVIGTIIALTLVSALLIVSLGSVRYGLLSLLPNLLPAAMTFGVWGIISGEVGLVVSIIACMTLGIIIDDTVHFLSKYVRAKREQNLNTEQAVTFAFETVGIALIATSIILVANFGVMGFSHYYPNAATGILTSMTITFAVAVHFLFFVPLLLTIDAKHDK
jgi:predicted RND superfamily exporter protein